VKFFEAHEELPAKEFRQHLDPDEEAVLARFPVSLISQAAAGNNIVQMEMIHEVLPPGMQDRDEPDLRAQAPGKTCSSIHPIVL